MKTSGIVGPSQAFPARVRSSFAILAAVPFGLIGLHTIAGCGQAEGEAPGTVPVGPSVPMPSTVPSAPPSGGTAPGVAATAPVQPTTPSVSPSVTPAGPANSDGPGVGVTPSTTPSSIAPVSPSTSPTDSGDTTTGDTTTGDATTGDTTSNETTGGSATDDGNPSQPEDSTGDSTSDANETDKSEPSDVDPTEVESYLSSLPCGARYSALGDGGWNFCLRLQDGGGACVGGSSAQFTRVAFSDGTPVSNVAQVTGAGTGDGVMLVTSDGALYTGGTPTNVGTSPLIASGVVNISAGANARVALVKDGSGFAVVGWVGDGTPAPIALPAGVKPVQVSANYGLACALDTQGAVYCWEAGGNHDIAGVTTTPSLVGLEAPSKMVSVGQNSVCAVTFYDTLQCVAHFYSSPWLPTRADGGEVSLETSSFPSVRDVTAGFHQGIIVKTDGTAYYLGHTDVGSDNPGVAFTGATSVVASGGDRGRACVQTEDGSVYCMTGSSATVATVDGQPLKAAAADCPY